ncbi:MAG: hypothetical protein IPP17_07000 [Bacteroidetes bacterium]|nr:hypothetical protein [Bacteroidota bacterium]
MKRLLLLIGLLLPMFSFAQVQFQKTYGGTGDEYFYSTWITADGGYVCAGRTGSYGVGDYDCFLARLNANGDTLWTRTYGTGLYDEVQSCIKRQTAGSSWRAILQPLPTSMGMLIC